MRSVTALFSALVFSAVLFSGQAYSSEKWAVDALNDEMQKILKLAEENKISQIDAARRLLKAAKMYVPDDRAFMAFAEEALSISEQFEKKKITAKKKEQLMQENIERLQEFKTREQEAKEFDRQMAETRRDMEEYERRRSAEENRRIQREREEAYARQQAAIEEENRSRAATATFLNSIGNSIRRTYTRGTTCNTWGNNTTCSNY